MKLEERRKLHEMTKEQLQADLSETEQRLLTFRFDAGMKRLSNTAGLHHARKRIALLNTLIRQRDLLAEHGLATMDEYKAYKLAERKSYRARKAVR